MTPDQRTQDPSPLTTLTEAGFQEIYRVLATGVVSAASVESGVTANLLMSEPPHYEASGLGPFSTFEEVRAVFPNVKVVRDRETGRTLYRLGDEFMNEEALRLIISLNPDSETREEAQHILDSIRTQ